jgi:hypothetical protein
MSNTSFSRAFFHSWLRHQPAGSVVGLAAVAAGCPLARFLIEVTGHAAIVRTRSYWRPPWTAARPLPEWAWRFALLLDHSYVIGEHDRVVMGRPIKREQALAVLGQVMEDRA